MEEVESLQSILSGSATDSPEVTAAPAAPPPDVKAAEAAVAAPSAAPEPVAETKPAEVVRDESGRFAKPDAKEPKPEPMVPLSALLAERAKRQSAPAAPEPKVSIFENEDEGVASRVNEHLTPVKEQVFNLSLELAKAKHADFDDMAKAFVDAAERDPRLWDAMKSSPNPAMYTYQVGRQIRELSDVNGDIVKYGEKKTAEVRSELEKERAERAAMAAEVATLKKQIADLQALPSSLNSQSSAPNPRAVVDEDETDIRQLVRFGNNKR